LIVVPYGATTGLTAEPPFESYIRLKFFLE